MRGIFSRCLGAWSLQLEAWNGISEYRSQRINSVAAIRSMVKATLSLWCNYREALRLPFLGGWISPNGIWSLFIGIKLVCRLPFRSILGFIMVGSLIMKHILLFLPDKVFTSRRWIGLSFVFLVPLKGRARETEGSAPVTWQWRLPSYIQQNYEQAYSQKSTIDS